MISYPEFYKHLDLLYEKRLDYKNYNNYIKSFKERMTEDELVYYLLSSISCFIKSYNNQGFLYILGVVMIFIIKALEEINPEKYSKWGYIDLDSFNLLYGSDEVILKEVVKFFIGKIFTIKKINEKKSYTVFRIS